MIFVALPRLMSKETGVVDNEFFVILQIDPIWFENGFIEVNISRTGISRIKLQIKCLKMMQTKFVLHYLAFRKIHKFHSMRFFFLGKLTLGIT